MTTQKPKPQSILYYPIATVASADLQDVFRLSQVGNQLSVADEALVRWEFPHLRSSMVGDIVENDAGLFRCLPSGWRQL